MEGEQAARWLQSTSGSGSARGGEAVVERLERCYRLNVGIAETVTEFPLSLLPGLLEASHQMFKRVFNDRPDLRTANVGFKLLGLAWAVRARVDCVRPVSPLERQIIRAAVEAQSLLRHSVERFLRSQACRAPGLNSPTPESGRGGRVHVLSSPDSSGYLMLRAQMQRSRQELGEHVEFGAVTVGGSSGMYARAWAPRESRHWSSRGETYEPPRAAKDWGEVGDWLASLTQSEPVLLLGMPVVPAGVLERARSPVLNAHNGPLPALRGLDALGWSMLLGHPPVATSHLVVAEVDRGATLAEEEVPVFPTDTVRLRLKEAQINVLLSAASQVRDTDATVLGSQTVGGRYYGRLHPVIRRVLDEALTHTTDHGQYSHARCERPPTDCAP